MQDPLSVSFSWFLVSPAAWVQFPLSTTWLRLPVRGFWTSWIMALHRFPLSYPRLCTYKDTGQAKLFPLLCFHNTDLCSNQMCKGMGRSLPCNQPSNQHGGPYQLSPDDVYWNTPSDSRLKPCETAPSPALPPPLLPLPGLDASFKLLRC